MPELRIALFTGNYNHIKDGVSLTLNRLVTFLEARSIPVIIFGPTIDKPEIDHTGELFPVPSVSAPGRPEYRISTGLPKTAKQKLDEFNPSLIHIATPDILGFKALKYAKSRSKVAVASYHTHFTSYLRYYNLAILETLVWKYLVWFYRQCRHIYVPTPSMKAQLEEQGINRLKIWARGVDTDLFNPGKRSSAWRESHGFKPSDFVISFVSRLVWEKGLKTYVDVIKKLQTLSSEVQALVVGAGPAGKEMQKMLPEAVFTGFLEGEELAAAYASSDLFLFPSDTETFGNVTLEALASGLPAVVADAAGSRSLVDDGKNGYLIEPGNTEQFVEKIITVIEDRKLKNHLQSEACKKAQQYTWTAVNEQLLGYYNRALKKANNTHSV